MVNEIKLKSSDADIWFTADTHYWHKNMTYGESSWENKETSCRRFDTTREMSMHIVNQINKYVKENDILIHLGDWSFSGIDNIWNFRKQLNVKRIYLCAGNHDVHIKKNYILPNVHRTQPYGSELADGEGLFASDNEYPDYVEAQSLFTLVDDYFEIMIDKTLFCCMHFPIAEWNDRYHKSYCLHGHSHGNMEFKNGRLDVGIDNVFKMTGEYRPLQYQEVLGVLKNEWE